MAGKNGGQEQSHSGKGTVEPGRSREGNNPNTLEFGFFFLFYVLFFHIIPF